MSRSPKWSLIATNDTSSINKYLEDHVYPRVSADMVYTHSAHRFKKSQNKWRGGCPWHESESGTSFVVNPDTLQWFCAGCSEGGHVIEYLAKLSNVPVPVVGEDRRAMAERVASLAGVQLPVPELTEREREHARILDVRCQILEWVIKDCRARLWSDAGTNARAYLHRRGFTDEQIRDLQLGLHGHAKDLLNRLPGAFDRRDIDQTAAIDPKMQGHIVVPWLDAYGKPLTLYGRWPGNPPSDEPKTRALRGDGTKHSPLYFDRARTSQHRHLTVVEGVFDAAMAQATGVTNVVACVAAQLSAGQVATLKRHRVQSVTICLDPDEAGDNGILSCIRSLDNAGITPYVAPQLPNSLDPDEYIVQFGAEAFEEHVGKAQHGYRYRAESLIREHDLSTDAGKSELLIQARMFASENDRNSDHLTAFFWPVITERLGLQGEAPDVTDASGDGATIEHFRAYMPQHQYIFIPDGNLWPASSINNRLPRVPTGEVDERGNEKTITASVWLDKHRPVEQMTWAPDEDQLIGDKLVSDGGWIDHRGATVFNLYRPPRVTEGDPRRALHWINHVERVYGDHAEHIINWFAHRIQRPGEKINHALVLGGSQGIGKDTMLEPVKYGVGPWNFQEVSPSQLLGRFNGFVKSIVLRVSEARDLGDIDRYAFYEHLKVYTAAPPDVIRVDEKNKHEYAVFNVCGVIITTNHKTSGMYLPPDDRRHFVAWSEVDPTSFSPEYFPFLYRWFADGGAAHVAAYLRELDLSGFDAKAPPPKTAAFWDIVSANQAPEDAELADVLDQLGNPLAVSTMQVISRADDDLRVWLKDRKNSRAIPHRFEALGYVRVRNDLVKDGQWIIAGKRQAVYARAELDPRDRIAAARDLTNYGYLKEVA